jgi:hypothetical protein
MTRARTIFDLFFVTGMNPTGAVKVLARIALVEPTAVGPEGIIAQSRQSHSLAVHQSFGYLGRDPGTNTIAFLPLTLVR